MKKLSDFVKEKARLVTGKISLKDKLCLKDIEQIYWEVVSSVMTDPRDPVMNLHSYMLPPDVAESEILTSKRCRKMV